MKKGTVLNQALSEVIAGLGHGDILVIADAGLPIPRNVRRIDLALTCGIPSFFAVLDTVLAEMQVETAIIADEMTDTSPHIYEKLGDKFRGLAVHTVSHVEFKEITRNAVAIVRTGECTPYANIVLKAGVTF